jgi:radical SAM protein with 4Fe4S-binding SPASM domain
MMPLENYVTVADKTHSYVSIFDPLSGMSVRSNVYAPDGTDTGRDPFRASFPELLDIGIMGHCAHGLSGRCLQSGVECYQDGLHIQQPNMPLARFRQIIDQCQGRTFQVALGGRGDPDMHEDFAAILEYARICGVVPNFTTSGYGLGNGLQDGLLPVIKASCGAVAVSWYRSDYTLAAIRKLVAAGIKTNIHYCLSRATIDEAITRLEEQNFPEGINRIIFLLHKPVGLGSQAKMLTSDDPRVRRFFALFDDPRYADKAGFDSCSVPGLLQHTTRILPASVEPCEAARFSAYISPDFKLYPCSFEQQPQMSISLAENSIAQAWNSPVFDQFRQRFHSRCQDCRQYDHCLGGCPVLPAITLCTRSVQPDQQPAMPVSVPAALPHNSPSPK